MDELERRNLEAELASALANRKHCLDAARNDKAHAHTFTLNSNLWGCVAEDIQERLEQ